MVEVGPVGPVNLCCGAYPGHRPECGSVAAATWRAEQDPVAALTPDDIAWLTAHGWEPDAMPTGEAFLARYTRPELFSRDY